MSTGQSNGEFSSWTVSSHTVDGWKLVLWCYENHIELILRPPNTTSISQPEDVILFKVFKRVWYEFKETRLRERIEKALRDKIKGGVFLSWEDVCEGVRLAFEQAFIPKYMEAAWKAVGVRPFSHRVEKRLRAKENKSADEMKLKTGVRSVSLAQAMRIANAIEDNDIFGNDGGRKRAKRNKFDVPLTHEEAMALGYTRCGRGV
jgi:hypothetical protein